MRRSSRLAPVDRSLRRSLLLVGDVRDRLDRAHLLEVIEFLNEATVHRGGQFDSGARSSWALWVVLRCRVDFPGADQVRALSMYRSEAAISGSNRPPRHRPDLLHPNDLLLADDRQGFAMRSAISCSPMTSPGENTADTGSKKVSTRVVAAKRASPFITFSPLPRLFQASIAAKPKATMRVAPPSIAGPKVEAMATPAALATEPTASMD